MSDTNSTNPSGLLHFLNRQRKPVAYGLCIGAMLTIGLTLWLGMRVYPSAKLPILVWGGGVTLALLVMGLVQLFHEPELESELRTQRVIVLAAGAWVGLATTVASVLFAWDWWSDLLSWLEPAGERQNGGGVLLMAVMLVVGLAIMFFSLQLARAEERSSPGFRRLLYGYNAVLTLLLVVFNLLILNCLVTARASTPIDFTASGVYTLSGTTDNILKGLKSPVTVIAILDSFPRQEYGNLDLGDHMRNLLANCSLRTDKLDAVVLDPSNPNDIQKLAQLEKQFPTISVDVPPSPQAPRGGKVIRRGVLVVVESGGKPQSHFIADTELFTFDAMGPGETAAFKGEDALMTQLQYLMDEQRKAIVYVTQGNGEPDLNLARDSELTQGLGVLKQRLEKWNYDVKPLTFSTIEAKVPNDADLVVVAGPDRPMPDFALKALREYLGPRRGKMVLFLGLVVNRDGTVRQTGMEGIVGEYGVMLGNDRVLAFSGEPTMLLTDVNPANPLGAELKSDNVLTEGARSVETPQQNPQMPARFRADTLLATTSRDWVIRDSNLAVTPIQVVENLSRQPKEVIIKRVTKSIPLGVTVTESSFNPADPHAAMRGQSESKPKLVIFGSSTIPANRFVTERLRLDNFDLVRSSFEWLRERQASIGIGPKTHNHYQLDRTIDPWRLALLPGGIVIAALAGLGISVALVRRR